MKRMRWMIAVTLALIAFAARAEWTQIGVSRKAGDAFTLYVDPATIQRNGNLARIWDLQDFREPQSVDGQLYLSEKTQIEFDCEAKKARVLATIDCADRMCTGKVVYSDADTSEWTAVGANTLGELEWKAACAVKAEP
jgi:hypothetical protein